MFSWNYSKSPPSLCKWMQEAEMKHQLLTPLTCMDHTWIPTCQAWIQPPELCCAVCTPMGGIWDLCRPDTMREQFLQCPGLYRNPISMERQTSLRQNFCGGWWVQGNLHVHIHLKRSHMGTARKFHSYILNTGSF